MKNNNKKRYSFTKPFDYDGTWSKWFQLLVFMTEMDINTKRIQPSYFYETRTVQSLIKADFLKKDYIHNTYRITEKTKDLILQNYRSYKTAINELISEYRSYYNDLRDYYLKQKIKKIENIKVKYSEHSDDYFKWFIFLVFITEIDTCKNGIDIKKLNKKYSSKIQKFKNENYIKKNEDTGLYNVTEKTNLLIIHHFNKHLKAFKWLKKTYSYDYSEYLKYYNDLNNNEN